MKTIINIIMLTVLICMINLAVAAETGANQTEPPEINLGGPTNDNTSPPPALDDNRKGWVGREGKNRMRNMAGEERGNRRGVMGKGQFAQVYGEKLMAFLGEHAPPLAERLEGIREKNADEFNVQLNYLGRIFGPVMIQMQRNPEIGQLSLDKIQMRLKTEQAKRNVNSAAPDNKAPAIETLRVNLNELFDLIIKYEETQLVEGQENLKRWETFGMPDGLPDEPMHEMAMDGPPPVYPEGEGPEEFGPPMPPMGQDMPEMGRRGMGVGRQMRGRAEDRNQSPEEIEKRLAHINKKMEESRERLTYWKNHKEEIVGQRLDQLLKDEEHPFPWGR